MTVQRFANYAIIGAFALMTVLVVQCSGACDRETMRDYMRQCSHVYITKRSIPEGPVADRSIRLRSAHNTNVCQPIKPNEIADYADGPEPDEITEDLLQKMNEMLEDYQKEEALQRTGLYRWRSGRHVRGRGPIPRGAFQCDISILDKLCPNK